MLELKGKENRNCKIFIDTIEDSALSTIYNILDNKITRDVPIRIMPDVHDGKAIVIGFTMPLTEGILSEWVGVDIGCGVVSAIFPKSTKLDLATVNKKALGAIPTGMKIHPRNVFGDIPFDEPQKIADTFVSEFNKRFGTNHTAPTFNEKWLEKKLKDIHIDPKTFHYSIGTLGGGNHYMEIGSNQKEYLLTIHSGSRNFGLKIANYWSKVAKDSMAKPTDEYNKRLENIKMNTADKKQIPRLINDLKEEFNLGVKAKNAYLSGENLIGYLFDMIFAQCYATWNRRTMLEEFRKILKLKEFDEVFETVHNYIDFKDFIIRKGAVSSYDGQKLVIPLNMRDGVLVCEGKSNEDWNCSAPHGAGRIMSRGEARGKIDLEKFKATMKDVYSTSVNKDTLDEAPFAYKKASLIENAIVPTATILAKYKPVLNIKDSAKNKTWKQIREEKKRKR